MNDLIDRQATIDALDALCQEHRYKIPGKRETYSQYNEAWQDALDRAEAAIFNLPSVHPDHVADIGKKVSISCAHENDVISRKAAIDALARMMPRSYTPDGSHPADEEIFRAQEVFVDCIEALEILPAVQPEIIRCKDCDWWTKQKDSVQGRCELMQMYPAGGWYCGNARRRPNEQT